MSTEVQVTRTTRKQSLVVNTIRACGKCGAPGFWHNTPGVNVGCYAPEKVTKLGENPVGPICPNCGATREAVTAHGEVWKKEWKVGLWPVIRGAITDLFNRRRAG